MVTKRSNLKKDTIAESIHHKTLFTKGWNKLSITTYPNVSPDTQAYIAGYIEGRQTFKDINDFFYNTKSNNQNGPFGPLFLELQNFFKNVNLFIISKR